MRLRLRLGGDVQRQVIAGIDATRRLLQIQRRHALWITGVMEGPCDVERMWRVLTRKVRAPGDSAKLKLCSHRSRAQFYVVQRIHAGTS